MAIYVVMEPAGRSAGDPERVAFVREGFSLAALIVPVLWLLWHRLWIEALLVFAAGAVMAATAQALQVAPAVSLAFGLLVGLYVALEGPALRLAALRRRGWREWGVVKADDRVEAEERHILEAFEDQQKPGPAAPAPAERRHRSAQAEPALGLFGYPGER